MSLLNRVALSVVAALGLASLVGCGSSTHNPVPPPSGAFSNTSFNGTYTFSISGTDIDAASNPSFFAMAGTITACGCTAGTISGGSVDLSDFSGTGSALTVNNSGSVYTINSDGRGKASLSVAIGGGNNTTVVLDFVLTSSSHGLISRFDGGGTGSGTIDLQPSAISQIAFANTAFGFSLSGSDGAGNPLSSVGSFTLDSSGNIVNSPAGVEDFTRYNFAAISATAFPSLPLSGSVQVGTGNSPGTAVLNTGATGFGALTFDVYAIDSTHLKLIERDGVELLVGDVFAQPSATVPAGNLVFTMAGIDSAQNPFAAGGTATVSSNQLAGAEDVNDNGVVDLNTNPATPVNFTSNTITNSPAGSGRFEVTLSGFLGGTTFAAYPSSGGILLQEIDSGPTGGITAGVALAQTQGASLAASQGYGMNLTGTDLSSGFEIDEIAEFATTSSNMTGLIDLNDFTVSNPSTINLAGTYAAASNGTGSATFRTGPLGGMFYYAADSSTALFISTDGSDEGVGVLQAQSAPSAAQAAVMQRQVSMIRSVSHIHSAAKLRQTKR